MGKPEGTTWKAQARMGGYSYNESSGSRMGGGGASTGLIWLRIGTGGEHLNTQ